MNFLGRGNTSPGRVNSQDNPADGTIIAEALDFLDQGRGFDDNPLKPDDPDFFFPLWRSEACLMPKFETRYPKKATTRRKTSGIAIISRRDFVFME